MGAVATFNFATWVATYPEFTNCTPTQGQAWWDLGSIYFANDGTGPECDATRQAQLMYLLTSHIAWLNAPRDPQGNPAASGQPASSVVGRINSASEGSVSVSSEWQGSGSPSEAWYIQTRYGASFWAATAQFRTFQYAANPTFVPGAAFPGPFGFGLFGGRRGFRSRW